MTGGDFAELVFGPGGERLVVVAVEGAVIEPLGFEKDHRVVLLDGGEQQTLGIVGMEGITVFSPVTCAKIASGLCEWVWPPKMPPP